MPHLTEKQIGQNYAALMENVKQRSDEVRRIRLELRGSLSHPQSVFQFEYGTLQIRKICEAIAVATLLAHQVDGWQKITSKLTKMWNASEIFNALGKINRECFPRRAIIGRPIDGHQSTELVDDDGFSKESLKRIYNECGAILHEGTADFRAKQKQKELNIRELEQWHGAIIRVMNRHCIILPQSRALECVMIAPDGRARVWIHQFTGEQWIIPKESETLQGAQHPEDFHDE